MRASAATGEAGLYDPRFMGLEILAQHKFIKSLNKEDAFRQSELSKTKKVLLFVDLAVESAFRNSLLTKVPNVEVIGEESIDEGTTNFRDRENLCVLVDMVDGTDLLVRGFSNWCSAIVVFSPTLGQIEASYVALPGEVLCYATARRPGAYSVRLTDSALKKQPLQEARLKVKADKKLLRNATLCMYGQKSFAARNMLNMHKSRPKFVEFLEGISAKQVGERVDFRFYNLAGNPMMARIALGTVDAVIELNGQLPHDVIPGAFIAMKAGATFGSAEQERILTVGELTEFLYQPADQKIRYILASNPDLYADTFRILNG